jgi:CelD/BcsL family acetyltransferase involved in cellulose biosynthesis
VSAAIDMPATATETFVASGFAEIRDQWRELNLAARAGTMFLSPDWLEPWFAHFGAGKELQIICVREGGRLIGVLPLMLEEGRLAFLGDGETGCDYLDVIAAPGREREVLERAFEQVMELEWDVLDLDGMSRESPTAQWLAQRYPNLRATEGIVRDGRVRYVCPHIPLQGTYEQYLQGLSRRENLKRREKWLAKMPGYSITCARTPEEASVAIEAFLELHRLRWQADGGSDGLNDARHENFHREAVQRLARAGSLRLYTLYCARRPVASVYGVVHGGKFNYYQSGYNPDWASKSVGLVLLARTVSDAFSEGLSEFDFLRGNESYKADWARAERWAIQLRLWRGPRGRAQRAAGEARRFVRNTLKSAVPERALAEMRRARKILLGRGG